MLENLVNPQSLEQNLGVRLLRTGDLQYLQLSIGIKTGNATFPCPFCHWRMTGANRDAVDAVCTPRNIADDVNEFVRLGSKRELKLFVPWPARRASLCRQSYRCVCASLLAY